MWLKSIVPAVSLAALFATNSANAEGEEISRSTWGGQYIGFAVGVAHGKADPTVRAKANGYFITTDPGQVDPQGSRNIDETNLVGSLLWGLNRQTGLTVYGVEADVSLTNFDAQYSSGNIAYISLPTSTFSITTKVRSNWMASIRPRLGYAREDALMYVTAGPSLARFKYDFSFTDTNIPESASVHSSKVKLGWTAGLGYERKLQGDWSWKAEYLYSRFDNIIDESSALRTVPADGFTHKLDHEIHSLRIGLTKKF